MKMSRYLVLMLVVLLAASLACGLVGGGDSGNGGGGNGAPAGGDAGGGSDARTVRGFPVLPDASNVVDAEVAGIVSIVYKSKVSINEAADFYKTEMEALGYSTTQNATAPTGAALTFEGDKNVTVAIGNDPLDAGSISVTIATLP